MRGNGKGIAGVAPSAQLVVAKVLDAGGAGSIDDVNAGIKWVVDHGARVVNLSLGDNFLITSLLGTSLRGGLSILAPGGAGGGNEADDIYSTFWVRGKPNQYRYLAGTSMATPHVAGAVALLLAQGYDQQATIERILGTVDASSSCGSNSFNCRGRLDVARAVGSAPSPHPVSAPPSP